MSFPFGSGMPPYPNQNSAPYPQAGSNQNSTPPYPQHSPYPPQNSPYPAQNSPYPPQNSPYPPQQSPFPPQSSPYPPQSSGFSAPFGAGYPQQPTQGAYPNTTQHQPGYPTHSPYPSNPAPYPSQPSMAFGSGGYPSSSPYPRQSQNCPPQQPSYPNQMPNYSSPPPSSTNNTTNVHGGYPSPSMGGYQQPSARNVTKSKGTPTVVPYGDFNPVTDAHALRKAMKGWGTDEDAIINVLCRRSNGQRLEIERQYKTNFGKDLIEDLKSETSGNFERLLVALMTPIVEYYVKELHDAMAGIGTDEDVLIEILCSLSNYEINVIKQAYQSKYGKNLESELMSETSGNFKRLLVSLCCANRDESGMVDPEAAARDATELLRAGELRVGTDESTFNMVLCQRNFQQIRLICDEYYKITGHSLEQGIESEFSGDILDGLVAIVQCCSNKQAFFARRLHKSMAGIGTNDNQLIRIIVTRSEIDLADIKTVFEGLFNDSLRNWIKGDTSGHYKHALYALINEERS